MWSLIKWLVFLAIVGALALAVTGKKIGGKTIEEHLAPLIGSKAVKEGIKDIRSILGEGLKAAGEAVSEDVTTDEKKELDKLVQQELQTGKPVEMPPNQQALPPNVQKGAEVQGAPPTRPGPNEMQAMPNYQPSEGSKGVEERNIR